MLLYLLYLYLGIGLVYALYIYINTPEEWYKIPLNLIGGPLTLVFIIIRTLTGKKMPRF